jgi:NhaP-type Na+/H+ or K+/H+ antiporter
MTLAGASVVASAYDTNRPRVLRVRRVAFLLSLFVVVITIFSIGLAFDPGTVLLLFVAARTARRAPAHGV